MSLLLNVIIVFIIVLFSINRLNKNYKIFYLLLYVYYQGLITSASLTYIETSIHITEQGRQSYFVWSNLIFLIFFILSILTLELVVKAFDKKVKVNIPWFSLNTKTLEFSIIYYLSFLILGLLLFNLLLSESALFTTGISRFNYWRNSKLPFLNTLFGNTATFLPFMFGLIYLKKRNKAIFLLVIYIIYLVFIGQKFSPIVRSLYVFFIPLVLNSNLKFEFNIFNILKSYFTPVSLLLFGVVYYKYAIHNPFRYFGIESPLEAIFYRAFGLQAHLFWGCAEQFVYVGEPKSWDLAELYNGMHTLMRYFWFGELEHIEKSMQNGFSFANAYPAILLKVFPLGIAYFIHVLLVGFILAPIIWIFKVSILKNRLFFSCLIFQCFNWTGISFIMGYFNKAIPGILILILLSFYSFLFIKAKIKKTNVEQNKKV